MKSWGKEILHTSKQEILDYCVNDSQWQEFRLSMKGVSTEKKLQMLHEWWHKNNAMESRRARVQIDNYLNALKRGGQLNTANEVVR